LKTEIKLEVESLVQQESETELKLQNDNNSALPRMIYMYIEASFNFFFSYLKTEGWFSKLISIL